MSGTCGRRMLILLSICPPRSFLPARSFLPFVPPSFSSFSAFLLTSSQSAAGGEQQAGLDAASGAGGRPPRPGPRWVPEAATPEAGPGSRTPRPARHNLRRATGRCGWEKRETEKRGSKGKSFAAVAEADGDEKRRVEVLLLWSSRGEGAALSVGRTQVRIRRCLARCWWRLGDLRSGTGAARG